MEFLSGNRVISILVGHESSTRIIFLPFLKAKDVSVIIRDNTNNNFLSEPEKMNFKVHKNHVN